MTDFANHILGHPFEVTNPFLWCTKAEVVRLLAQHGQADLIARSISCTHVWKKGPRAHCGECAQCIHRRVGILAAGLGESDPLKGYDVELLVDDRTNADSRTMALSLVSNALQYPRLTESGFINRYAGEVLEAAKTFSDETIEGAALRIYELHWRYGNEIGTVIADAIRQYAVHIREHTLPPGCLLRAAIMDQRSEVPLGDPFASNSGTADQDKGDTRISGARSASSSHWTKVEGKSLSMA
jgi:Queuosine biosynthesis protein QueC